MKEIIGIKFAELIKIKSCSRNKESERKHDINNS